MPHCNHNVHYAGLVLSSAPADCARALDVGCGDGWFTRRLAEPAGRTVIGIDADGGMIERARAAQARAPGETGAAVQIRFIETDLMSFETDMSFDFVCALASVHHMPFEPALATMASLLRPGGVLSVLGCFRERGLKDLALAGLAAPLNLGYSLRRNGAVREGGGSAPPLRDPEMSMHEIRVGAVRALPGASVRRLLLWRYLLTWEKPATSGAGER